MKKRLFLLIILCMMLVVGCGKYEKNDWGEDTFFNSVYAPNGKISKISKDYSENGKEFYTVLVNDYSYEKFYEYIMKLEDDGYHYEFLDEYVLDEVNKLPDNTETSWRAHKDNIYIIANWRSRDNANYSGYNLQLLFYNYDYTK